MYIKYLIFGALLCLVACTQKESVTPTIVSTDVTHFWEAYDSINATADRDRKLAHLQTLFLDRASHGQQRMISARNYTADDYLKSIEEYPKFWNSIRPNMQEFSLYNDKLITGVKQLKEIYPELKSSTLYYTIGAHRSPGTGVDSLVLIGSEFALGDSTIATDELSEHLQSYYQINPTDHLQFLTVHEYVHTQQSGMIHDLLSLALYEGIGDFVAEKATNKRSPFKAFEYGPANVEKVKERFRKDMFSPNTIFSWLWNSPNNEFGTSDMGYYVGYSIADGYYQSSEDKTQAIRELIELDYSDREGVYRLVDKSGYFDRPLAELAEDYEQLKPTVLRIEPINDKEVEVANVSQITIHFSEPMDERYRNFDYGPMGEEAAVRITGLVGYSDDRTVLTLSIAPLEANKQYQLTVGSGFRNDNGIPLKPYLLDFRTRR